ncbi:hypothetical protein [Actinomadura rubrisoli]|uniref:Uncharacterized protein n=1 Tax=Actinomadura rubrisoli TaxID=2530368 RepID=A0A4R5AW42_9ACTN|nr:hypothetical protein [Actinomadura rubrisoli]TDD74842.1 hypothetical protein E1298_32115 [Actinomadura rubrisoli]
MHFLSAGNSPADKEIAVDGRWFTNLGPVYDGHHAKIRDWHLFLHDGYWYIGQVAEIRDHGHQVRFIGDRRWMPVSGMAALQTPQ